MDSGFMALSIYCVQMAPKWSCVLDSQPIQGKDMSVQVYYDQFCSWRSKLEAVNYIGDEEWYVDDFLCGLKMDLVVRVLGYKWRPRRLSDAFRRAEIEEIMLSWKENPRKNDADEVFEEMSHPESVNSAELGAEDISDENSDDVLDASGLIATNADFCSMLQAFNSVREDVGGLGGLGKTSDNVIDPIQESEFSSFEAGIQLVEKAEQSFPSKLEVVELAYEMFDEMTDLIPTARHSFSSVSLIRNERNDDSVLNRADYCKFDEVLGPFSVKHNTRIDIQEVLEPPTFDLLKILGCDFINSNGLKQDFDKMVSNLNVELWVGMVPMFVFDPGGSSIYHMSCHSSQELPYVASSIWCRLRNFARNVKLNSVLDFVGYVSVEVLVVYVKMGGNTSGNSNTRMGIGDVLAHVVPAVAILGLIACVIHRHKLRVGGYGKKMEGSHLMTSGPFLMPIKTILNPSRCVHYKRKCKIRAPCCDEIFDCRHCHNEAKNSLEIDPFLRHDLPRHEVKSVICSNCGAEQDVQQNCQNCGVCMGKYFCEKCNFFDEDVSKQQYHCEECGICRTGGKENFFHCNKCGCCYSKSIKDSHHCIDRAMHHNCPVCFELLFDSVKDITVLQCGHTMHVYCVKEMELRKRFTCPVCSKSICDLSNVWEKLEQENLQHQCQSGKKRAFVSSKGILVYGRLPAHFMFMKKYFQVVTKLLF